MQRRTFAAVALAGLIIAGCSGGSSSNSTPTSQTTAAPRTVQAAGSPAPRPSAHASTAEAGTPVSPGDTADVTGVVGTITTDPKSIEITRLSGAPVTRIEIENSTDIRSAGGGRIDFTAIKTSDRIIAEGRISDRGDALVATRVTVSAVVPGAQPGG